MQYIYRARTKKGEIQEGTVEAEDEGGALDILQRHGLVVITLKSTKEVSTLARSVGFLERIKKREIVLFSRQLSTLFEAEVPVVVALRTLVKQATNPVLQRKLNEIAGDVEGGMMLSDAFARHPRLFSSFYINMVKSGEASGKLQETLIYLADYLEREYYISEKVKGAMVYPAFILTVFFLVGAAMMIWVVPQLTSILKETGQELPLTTRMLIGTSNFLRTKWWLLLGTLIGLVIAVIYYHRTPGGKSNWDRIAIKLPIFGKLLRKIYLARLAESLSTLIVGGLPIVRALKLTGEVVGNIVYKDLMFETARGVKGGKPIASVMLESAFIPPLMSQMVNVGEETGKLAPILKKLGEFYQKEIGYAIETLTSLIEPLLILVLGGAAGILVASILLPIYNIAGGM